LVLKLPYFINHAYLPAEISTGIVGSSFHELISANKFFLLAFQMVLIVSQATIINTLFNKYRFTRDPNLYAGLVWILVSCMFPFYFFSTSVLCANLFFLLAVAELFTVYKRSDATTVIFNIGIYLSTATFFLPSYWFFLIGFLMGLQVLRAPKLKEFLILSTGVLAPYILLCSYFYWNNSLESVYVEQLKSFSFNYKWVSVQNGLYKLIFIGIIVLTVLLKYGNIIFKQSIQNIKYIEICYIFLLIAVIQLFFNGGLNIEQFLSITLPLSILGGIFLFNIPSIWAELIHLFLIFAIYFWQFGPNI
jgi:hypothetical protein